MMLFACFPSSEIYLLSFVCMLSQNVVLHAFKGCCLHAFPCFMELSWSDQTSHLNIINKQILKQIQNHKQKDKSVNASLYLYNC